MSFLHLAIADMVDCRSVWGLIWKKRAKNIIAFDNSHVSVEAMCTVKQITLPINAL